MSRSARARCLVLLAFSLSLAACVSHEPRQLVPQISLSPEQMSFSTGTDAEAPAAGVTFGLSGTLNESDSLSNLTVLPGVRVRSVNPGGPADRAGLRPGDVILSIDGRETNHPDLIAALEQESDEARSFSFEIRRNTAVFEVEVQARPAGREAQPARELYRVDPLALRAGFITGIFTMPETGSVTGARVTRLFPESPLAGAGIREGDVIIALDGESIPSAQGFIDLLYDNYSLGDRVELSVLAQGSSSGGISEHSLDLWDPGRRISEISFGPLLRYESTLNPDRTRLSLLDLWLFSLFSYEQVEGEAEYAILGLFRFATGYGELLEN